MTGTVKTVLHVSSTILSGHPVLGGWLSTGIFLVKVIATISDFFSSGRLWKEGNIYQGGGQ